MKDPNIENNFFSENEIEKSFDFKAEFFKILSYWKLFVISLFLCLTIAFLYLRYSTPIYKVSCKVLIKDDSKSKYASNSIISELDVFKQQSNLQNEIGIIQSKTLSRKTVRDMDFFISYYFYTNKLNRKIEIFDECPFSVIIDTSHIQLLNTPVNVTFSSLDKANIKINEFGGSVPYYFSNNTNKTKAGVTTTPVDLNIKMNELYTTGSFSFKLVKNSDFNEVVDLNRNYSFILSDPMSVGESFANSIETNKIDEGASIVEITISSSLPSKSIKFLNALTENYINLNLENKNLTATKTIDFIDSQLGQITDSLHEVEDILENFRTSNKTIDLSTEYEAIVAKIEAQDNEKVKINIEIKYFEYILNYLLTSSEYDDIVSPSLIGVTDEAINTLVTKLMTLASEKNKLGISSTENNPYLTNVEANITATKKALITQVKNSLGLCQISLKDINKRISESEVAISKLPGTERDLLTIQRKFNLNDETYSFLLEKKAEASISKASNLSNNIMVDPAELAAKTHPKNNQVYLIALIIGILLPYLIIRLREYMNDTIQEKSDIESQTSLPIIGTIAHSKYETSMVVIDRPRSMVSESIRSTKANMDFVSAKGNNIIALTSTVGGEGKTYCSINLACSFAISDMKTVLIGADLRRPKIFADFNLTNDKGLTSFLIGKCNLEEIVNETHVKNLDIITAGPLPPNPAELLSGEKMKELLVELRKKYDYIIIDTPPLGIVTDALFLMKHADINIYVTRFNYTSKKVVKDVNDIVKTTGLKNVCFLLNDVMFKKNTYGKYGRYTNSYRYAYTYNESYYED